MGTLHLCLTLTHTHTLTRACAHMYHSADTQGAGSIYFVQSAILMCSVQPTDENLKKFLKSRANIALR